MNKRLVSLALIASSPVAVAQNCLHGDFGTRLGGGVYDVIFPIQSIGFAFPLGGVTYTDIHVTTHGFVTLSNAGVPAPPAVSTLYTPTTANFMAGAPKVCAIYSDIVVPNGEVFIRTDPTQCTITWKNAECYFITPQVLFSFQLTLYPSGMVRCTYGPGVTNNSSFGGVSAHAIVGLTPAGGLPLPAQVDLSAGGANGNDTTFENWTIANTFDMANNSLLMVPTLPGYFYSALGAPANCATTANYGTGCDGMALTALGPPSFGSNVALRTSGIPVVSPISFVSWGTAVVDPGIPLAVIGMPGCFAYNNLDIGLYTSGAVISGVSDLALAIPGNPSLLGTLLAAQAVALSVNILPLGFAASNGTSVTVGY